MRINKQGFSTLSFMISAPLFLLGIFGLITLLYYFSFRVASQYHSYQALICSLNLEKNLCLKEFRKNLELFGGIQIQSLSMLEKETSKSFKVKIHWQDNFPFYPMPILRSNSVYIPKKL